MCVIPFDGSLWAPCGVILGTNLIDAESKSYIEAYVGLGGSSFGCNAVGQCLDSQDILINLVAIDHTGPLAQKVWKSHYFLGCVVVDA